MMIYTERVVTPLSLCVWDAALPRCVCMCVSARACELTSRPLRPWRFIPHVVDYSGVRLAVVYSGYMLQVPGEQNNGPVKMRRRVPTSRLGAFEFAHVCRRCSSHVFRTLCYYSILFLCWPYNVCTCIMWMHVVFLIPHHSRKSHSRVTTK